MLFKSLVQALAILGFVAVANAAAIEQRAFASTYCHADYCLRALRATQISTRLASASADCAAYLEVTYIPTDIVTVTAPIHETATVSSGTSIATVYHTPSLPQALEERKIAKRTATIPAYAATCSGEVRYTSACSCIGITTRNTVTAPAPTVTVTLTDTTTVASSFRTTTIPGLELTRPTPILKPRVDGYPYELDEDQRVWPLPFPIQAYGKTQDSVLVSVNGWIGLAYWAGRGFYNRQLPQISNDEYGMPQTAIAVLWEDIYIPDRNGLGVYFQVDGDEGSRVARIEWLAHEYVSRVGYLHFVLEWKEADPGKFTMRYYEVYDTGRLATIGAQASKTKYVQYSYMQGGAVPYGTVLYLDTIANTITPSSPPLP